MPRWKIDLSRRVRTNPITPKKFTLPVITLKIDVDTYRGTREGVPNLVTMLKQHKANATFLFSLGPDHTGWALRRAFRPGFFKKVSRTSVVEHYGIKTLMYGVMLPAPDIGRIAPPRCVRCAMRVLNAVFILGTMWCGKTMSDSATLRGPCGRCNCRMTASKIFLEWRRKPMVPPDGK